MDYEQAVVLAMLQTCT